MGKEGKWIQCLHPDPTKQGTHVLRWQYDLVHADLLADMPFIEHGAAFGELTSLLDDYSPAEDVSGLGSPPGCIVTETPDMEAGGKVGCVPGESLQRLRRRA